MIFKNLFLAALISFSLASYASQDEECVSFRLCFPGQNQENYHLMLENIPLSDTVKTLKEKIQVERGYPVEQQVIHTLFRHFYDEHNKSTTVLARELLDTDFIHNFYYKTPGSLANVYKKQ